MKKIAIDDVDHPPTITPATVLRPLERPLGTSDVAVNYFELAPGDTFGFDYHRHNDQEELFYVMAGTATFRTEDGDVEVRAGEVIRFAPREFQLGRNEAEERVRALAIGAPRETSEIEYLRDCAECGEETIQRPDLDRAAMVFEIQCEACESVIDRFELDH
jgi:uncharacterized cupin superfamily protein